MKSKGQVFYLFLPIAISSILFIGYKFAVSDQCIYIPIIESVFIVLPDTSGFRNFSKRAIVGDRKDGAPGPFSESYDLEYARRMKQLQSHGEFKDKDFMKFAEEYEASFAVTRRNHELGFQKVYENGDFYVYQLQ